MHEVNTEKTYLFNGGSFRRGVVGCLSERDGLLSVLTFFASLGGLALLYAWSRQGFVVDASLAFGLVFILWPWWHYVNVVVEIRTSTNHLSLRRLIRFKHIPWGDIAEVRVYRLATTGVAYVLVKRRGIL
jgi:hypothetical protein